MASTKTTVLVTGAGGFIGSAVVRCLVGSLRANGVKLWDGAPIERVVALRRGSSAERLRELEPGDDWSVECADLTDRSSVRALLLRVSPRAVLHVALDGSAYKHIPEAERTARHIAPVEELFTGLSEIPGARFIHTGSAWVLPAGSSLDESVRPEPRSSYAETKWQIDRLLPALQEKTGVNWINLRLFNTFGKYEKPSRLLPYLVARLTQGLVADLSQGELIRDFNDVDDMARAYRLALQAHDSACGQIYHIGSGHGTSLREFALTVAEATGNAHLIRFGAVKTPDEDLPCLVANTGRAQRILGWVPPAKIKERIVRAVEWWLHRADSDAASAPTIPLGSRAR